MLSKRRLASVIFGFGISGACLWWLLSNLDFGQVWEALKTANYLLILLAVLVTFTSYLLRAWRWEFFFRNRKVAPSYFDLVRCLFVGFFMNNILPARAGELVRAHIGGRHSREGRTEVLATIASERLADGLAISVMFSLFFTLFSPAGDLETGNEMFLVSSLFAMIAVSAAAVLALRNYVFILLEKISELLPGGISKFSLERVRRFLQGLEPLCDLQKLAVIIPLSALVWLVELLVYYLVSAAFNQSLSLGGLSLFLAAVNFSSLIPAAPGGVGVIEAFAALALSRIGLDYDVATAMVVTQHVVQILVVGIPGSIFFFGTMGGRLASESE